MVLVWLRTLGMSNSYYPLCRGYPVRNMVRLLLMILLIIPFCLATMQCIGGTVWCIIFSLTVLAIPNPLHASHHILGFLDASPILILLDLTNYIDC